MVSDGLFMASAGIGYTAVSLASFAAIYLWLSFCWKLRRSRSLILCMDKLFMGTLAS